MKKISIALGVCLTGYLSTVYFVDRFDAQLAEGRLKESSLPKNELSQKALRVITENGCRYCHTENSAMPFYAVLPGVSDLMQHDVKMAQRQFKLEDMLQKIQAGDRVSEVDLSKLESVLLDGSMPPKLYLGMHWGSLLSAEEKQVLSDWVKAERLRHTVSSTANQENRLEPIQPISTVSPTEPLKVALGEKLYHDTRLSGDNSVSCATCHGLNTGGVDRLNVSVGVKGAQGPINAPTVYNAVYNTHQFWDGRAANLQEQAGGPPMNPLEMASTSWKEIADKLAQDSQLKEEFSKVYPQEGITQNSITDAIAEFEKTLVTPNSRFDRYLKGDASVLTADEKAGYELFKAKKCATCHVGEAMGGQSFELMGLKKDYFADRGQLTEVDHGRFNVTKNPDDMHRFKVPTLRNVALTAPYFHDASAKTLEEAVDKMAVYQVGEKLSVDELNKIVAYLKTLNGEYKGAVLQ